jgi:uncharacterized protein (DUF2235 family)
MGGGAVMGRRIVLLSDGTGNSAAKVWRTNVWRLFEALDLSCSDQVACYDDGVGTSSFKPWAMLGGAFGFGLKRNVISLYKFACRNHRSQEDEIFGFGFSRGAFTIRVLMGLILDQGLVPAASITESELNRQALQAYRRYHRRHFHTNWWLILESIAKFLRRGKPRPSLSPAPFPVPRIRFLGLWDTVAAYGLPVEEMTRGVSQWIAPLELPSHTPNPLVQRACQALSLDDERTTFHPVLWNERNQPPQQGEVRYTRDEKITQIWFAGVHSNVGGGYPDDSLARIPLYWIMEEAKACNLTFKKSPLADPDPIVETRSAQDKDGRLYDSRSGLGIYYRFGPRRLYELCHQKFSRTTGDEVHVQTPKIHESVLKRIQNNAHVYAPIGIPAHYDVVVTEPSADGTSASFRLVSLPATAQAGQQDVYELSGNAVARVNCERRMIWPSVYLRAALYVVTVVITIAFVLFPFSGRPDPLGERESALRWMSDIIRAAGAFLPGWANQWMLGYAEYPLTFIMFGVVLWVMVSAGSKIASYTRDQMTLLWRQSLDHTIEDPGSPDSWQHKAGEAIVVFIKTYWKYAIAPALAAVAIVYAVVVCASHAAFNIFDDAGLTCKSVGSPVDVPDAGVLISFRPSALCYASGYKVARLEKYLVWVDPDPAKLTKYPGYQNTSRSCPLDQAGPLANGRIATGPWGYSTFHNNEDEELSWYETIKHVVLTPLRRELFRPWFQMVARYGVSGGEEDFLDPDPDPKVKDISEIIQPQIRGELFFYVNDAVIGFPWMFGIFYNDNHGCISVFIRPR